MIGPVQLLMIGTDSAEVPAQLRERVNQLRDNGAVRILDVLSLHKDRDGTVVTELVTDPVPEPPHEPGELISELLQEAGAVSRLSANPAAGRGYLTCADPVPEARTAIPPGSTVLALLIEHRWAIPLRDAVRDVDAFPVRDAWLGREVLRDIRLLPRED